jgi:hypothetical protein
MQCSFISSGWRQYLCRRIHLCTHRATWCPGDTSTWTEGQRIWTKVGKSVVKATLACAVACAPGSGAAQAASRRIHRTNGWLLSGVLGYCGGSDCANQDDAGTDAQGAAADEDDAPAEETQVAPTDDTATDTVPVATGPAGEVLPEDEDAPIDLSGLTDGAQSEDAPA